MNTRILTSPSPELKQSVDDLRENAGRVAQNFKNQANAGIEQVRSEATSRFQNAADLFQSAREFAGQHPVRTFGAGLLLGIAIASCRRSS
jgi:hypothetical protein